MHTNITRRGFIQKGVTVAAGLAAAPHLPAFSQAKEANMKFGLVTYQWGKDWDLPTLISNCEKTGLLGVELRTEHAHGVEVNLTSGQRTEVKKRFEDSPVTCVGYGSNFEYHSPDPGELRENIELTKAYIKLCEDIGATGIKVKPNTLPEGVPKEKTISQIAASLNEVGRFALSHGQTIRVEVHGKHTQELPNMKAIFDEVTEENVKICWNSNPTDLLPPGLEENFNMVKKWLGDTVHVGELDSVDYPYEGLFRLFKGMNYEGWILLETHNDPPDKIAAINKQSRLFDELIAKIK